MIEECSRWMVALKMIGQPNVPEEGCKTDVMSQVAIGAVARLMMLAKDHKSL
jgi:hypothetical protein